MAFLQMNIYSEALQFSTDVNVIVPTPCDLDEYAGTPYFVDGAKFQVLYLLHGTYADHHDWTRLSSIERYAQQHKLVVVCPSGENSFWQDMYAGPQYFTYLTRELPDVICKMFPVSRAKEDTFIGGLSMGACGALNAAIRCPERYAAAICLSSAMIFGKIPTHPIKKTQPWPVKAILPPPYDGKGTGIDDVPILEALKESGKEIPRIYMAVGYDDFAYGAVQETRKVMDRLCIPYTYEEGPGAHNWVFWDEYIQHALNWLNLRETTIQGR